MNEAAMVVPVEVCARTFRHQMDAFAAARVYFGDTLLCSLPSWLRWREPQVTRIFHCGTCGAPFLRG